MGVKELSPLLFLHQLSELDLEVRSDIAGMYFSEQNVRQGFTFLNSALSNESEKFNTRYDPDSLNPQSVVEYFCNVFESESPCFVSQNPSSNFFQLCANAINTHREKLDILWAKTLTPKNSRIYKRLLSNIHPHLPANLKIKVKNGVTAGCYIYIALEEMQELEKNLPLRQLQLI